MQKNRKAVLNNDKSDRGGSQFMRRIAIHDADAEHFGRMDKFPNYALMKISAWHKRQGDEVEWFSPIEAQHCTKECFVCKYENDCVSSCKGEKCSTCRFYERICKGQ